MDVNSLVPNGAIERLEKKKKKNTGLEELNKVKANGTFQTNDCVFFRNVPPNGKRKERKTLTKCEVAFLFVFFLPPSVENGCWRHSGSRGSAEQM